jgi:hypothetical protein
MNNVTYEIDSGQIQQLFTLTSGRGRLVLNFV